MNVAATPEAPKKKGLGPLAWILIGCGGLVLLAGLGFMGTVWWGANKIKAFAEKAEDNPKYAITKAAEMIVRMNPELELVSSDPDKGELTVRNEKTGEVVTLAAEDIQQGKFSVRVGDQKATFDVDGSEEEGGVLKITTDKGTATFGAGAGSDAPSWIPTYPNGSQEGLSSISANGERMGSFNLTTNDSAERVLAYFERELKSAGFEVQVARMDLNGALTGGNLTATRADRTLNVTVATQESGSTALVAYNEKP